MRRSLLLAVVILAASTYASPALADWPKNTRCSTAQKLSAELACGKRATWHARAALRFWASHSTQTAGQERRSVRDHRWLLRYGQWHMRRAHARLHPRPLVAHLAGWRCITNGAYPGAAHEGNGYNPAGYSGPLGMTTPWLGHYPPGSDWVHSDPLAVYAIAERERASVRPALRDGWMRGQWPHTYPPCAGYF